MKIQINNLGPIKRGEIPLNSDLLFFVGYNNSGKSYATQLIWAIYNEKFRTDFLNEIDLNKIIKLKEIDNFVLTKEIVFNIVKEFEKYIKDRIHLIFNLTKDEFKDFTIKFKIDDIDIEKLFKKRIKSKITKKVDNEKKVIEIKRIDGNVISIEGDISYFEFSNLKKIIVEYCFFSILNSAQSFFLPAIRGAYVNLFQYINRYEKEKKDLLDTIWNDSSSTDYMKFHSLMEETKSSYTMATNYLINKLTELNDKSPESEKYLEFLDIVKNMIGGEIIKKDSTLISNSSKFYLNLNETKDLPMHISSSTTNQLAPLYLFFKYWGHRNLRDMLIIDEPEENLHPENQVRFLEMMIKFVSMGNKVLITSHSSMLTKLLNSHIAFNELNKENKEKITKETGFESFDFITKDNVKVCFFNGEEILSYPVTEYGTMFKDFIEVEDTINNQYRLITNKVFEQNE